LQDVDRLAAAVRRAEARSRAGSLNLSAAAGEGSSGGASAAEADSRRAAAEAAIRLLKEERLVLREALSRIAGGVG